VLSFCRDVLKHGGSMPLPSPLAAMRAPLSPSPRRGSLLLNLTKLGIYP
jgi:hypothetical protein